MQNFHLLLHGCHVNTPQVQYVSATSVQYECVCKGRRWTGHCLLVAGRYSPEAPHSYVERRLTLFLARCRVVQRPSWSQPQEHKQRCCVSHKSLLPLKLPACFFPVQIPQPLNFSWQPVRKQQSKPHPEPPPSPSPSAPHQHIGDRQSSSLNKSLTS